MAVMFHCNFVSFDEIEATLKEAFDERFPTNRSQNETNAFRN
jgi:hypothetical protein